MGQDGTASDGTLDEASVVIGDVSIQVIGPAVVTDYLVGGGMCNAVAAGKVTIEVSDATLGELCWRTRRYPWERQRRHQRYR